MFFVGRETTDKYITPYNDTVDGRNPAPADMVNIPFFTGFYASQVVQDFFHQQYVYVQYEKYIYFSIGSILPQQRFYWRFPKFVFFNNLRQPRMVGLQGRPMEDEAKGSGGKIHHSKYCTWIFLICFFSSKNHHGWKIQREKTYILYIYVRCFNITGGETSADWLEVLFSSILQKLFL